MQVTSAEKIIEMLYKPLPKEGIQTYKTADGTELTGYKPQYYVDRLNELFPFEWTFDIVKDQDGKYMIYNRDGYVGCFCYLTIFFHDDNNVKQELTTVKQWGGVVIDGNISWPDAFKGAMSNALGKCCSYLGIGSEAYRGEIDLGMKAPKQGDPLKDLKNNIRMAAAEKGIKAKAFQKIAKDALDRVERIEVDELSKDELEIVLKAISNHDNKEPIKD